jgi:hypothetical protein
MLFYAVSSCKTHHGADMRYGKTYDLEGIAGYPGGGGERATLDS